ncbi:MAG TPA: AsmA-like C-terminal region-containing protein, partial [Candidatus Hydrogenedentes bacterium]|nr:AsmA-like C-terminal region-containing protein [Candidatus Hydrogenedentota bacterium]
TVAGTRWSALAGKTRLDRGVVLLEEAAAAVFGGSVGMTGSAALVEPGMPLKADMTVSDVDLSVFTQEFKPPSVVLTGRLSGTADLLVRGGKLADLHVDLTASSGFSLNKDMVEQLLTSQYVTGMTGGKQVSDVVRDVLGDAPQRPFDAARITLGLRDGRIEGVARLESRTLNLTMDIKADPEALLEALRAGGDGAAAEVANPGTMQ